MALTQIRGEQIRDGIIKNSHIASDAAISYSKLDLAGQIVASDLNNDGSVAQSTLESKLLTLWDMVQGVQTGTGSSVVVTTEVQASAAVDTPQTGTTAKGVLLTGTGTNGAGTTNYRVQLRNASTGEPIADGTDEDPGLAADASAVYGELRNDGSDFTLYFFDSNDQAYTFTTDTQVDFMFLEVFSYQTAPVKGFIAGVGFADVVGIQGSHNHDDRYYTKTFLDGGQLDNRYYTETELDTGQLDNRYFTETELDPAASATGDNVLDARYFRETEIASSASGSPGAALMGVDAAAVSGLDSTDVQSALAELQGDINDITSGALDITQSLDDAYNDGSVVTVDNTNVDFQISDTKSFKVSDSAGVGIVEVDALAAGDTLAVTADTDITGTFNVTGVTTLDTANIDGSVVISGNLTQHAGYISLSSNAAALLSANANDVTIETTVSGDVVLSSAGSVTFNDSIQTSAIPFSQTNADGFATEFAYDSQTEFDWSVRDIGTTAPASIMAGINANRQDLYEYVELLDTKGAAVGTAAGANLIGADGITGITPTNGTLGGDGTVQEMLEGIALTGGGSDKHFATLADFTNSKSSGDYFNTDTQIWVEDIERQIRVLVQGTGVVEGTDWDYIWGQARPMGGTSGSSTPKFHSIIDNTAADAIKLQATAGGIDVDGVGITIDSSAALALTGNTLTLNDQYTTAAIPFSQTGVAALSSNFDTATSIVGAVNENADDLYTLINTTLPATTDSASGADQIGVTGITGILPEGGTVGADATLQAMLEGIAKSAGGVKTYADTSAFTTDKANGSYLPVDTMVYLKDIDRFGIVLLENTQTVEGTDWDYLWGANQPMAGDEFKVTADAITTDISGNMSLKSGGSVDIYGSNELGSISISTGINQLLWGNIVIRGNHSVTISDNGGDQIDMNGGTTTIDSTTVDINAQLNATGAANDHMIVTASGTGQVQLVSAAEIDLDAPLIDIHGDVTIPDENWLSAGNINITSVSPDDTATITGSRSGTENPANLLTNGGFESGAGTDADNWTETAEATRSAIEKYFGSYSMKITATDLATDTTVLTSDPTSVTASTLSTVRLHYKGTSTGDISVKIGDGNAAVAIPAGTYTAWASVDVAITSGASGTALEIIAEGNGTEDYSMFVDAITLVEGSTAVDFLSDQMSELVFTIGDEDNDQIVFRSEGTTTQNLVTIAQDTVRIYGDLTVDGTTTTTDSTVVNIGDSQITLLADSTGTPSSNADFAVHRGTLGDVSLRWNESTDHWELSNDGSNYANIVTSGAGGALSMDQAYDGGSSVAVDDTNVAFTLSATKSFKVIDGTDASKFVVTEGSGADSVKIDTTGGVRLLAEGGFLCTSDTGNFDIEGYSGGKFRTNMAGGIEMYSNSGSQYLKMAQTGNTAELYAYGDVVITSAAALNVDTASADIDTTGAISLDALTASNFTIDAVDAAQTGTSVLTLSTVASGTGSAGNIAINSGDVVDVDAVTSVTVDAPAIDTTGILTQTGATQVIGDMNLDGSIDHDGATFNSTLTDTGAGSFTVDTVGGVAISSDVGTIIADDSGNQVALNADGSLDLHAAATTTASLATTGGAAFTTSDTEADITATTVDINATAGVMTLDATSDITISSDADVIINGGSQVSLLPTGTGADAVTINAILGGIDIDAGSTFTVDASGISLDSDAASNVSVTGADLTLSTITSGNVDVISAGEIIFSDSRLSGIEFTDASNAAFTSSATSIVGAINAAYAAAEGANTLDEVYDGETGTRTVVMDNGSIDFDVTDTYEFNIADSGNTNILSVKALATGDEVKIDASMDINAVTFDVDATGTTASAVKILSAGGVDIDSAEGITLTDDSGAYVNIQSSGAIVAQSGTGASATVSSDTLVALAGGAEVDLTATLIDVNGNLDVDGASVTMDTTAGISFDAAAASNFTVSGADLTFSTVTSGNIIVSSVGDLDVDGGAITIDGTAASNFTVTGNNVTLSTATAGNVILSSAGELTFQDSRTSAIPFSDASNTSLPGDSTSILGALTTAYEKSIDIGYEEKTASSTDVTNDYVVVTITELPTSGGTASPSSLRGNGYYVAVYLNGLRLSDTEWNYNYSGGTKQITFDGTDDITLVAGDKIMVEVRKIN